MNQECSVKKFTRTKRGAETGRLKYQDRDVTQIKKEISEKKKEYEEEMDTLKVSISKLEKCITKGFEEYRECRLKEWGEVNEVVWNFKECHMKNVWDFSQKILHISYRQCTI